MGAGFLFRMMQELWKQGAVAVAQHWECTSGCQTPHSTMVKTAKTRVMHVLLQLKTMVMETRKFIVPNHTTIRGEARV